MADTGMDVLRGLADAFNARDFARARELLSDDLVFVDHGMGATIHGSEGFVQYAGAWAHAFSNMRLELVARVGDSRYASAELVGRGVHDGTLPTPAGDVPPTGRPVEAPFVWAGEISDGKIRALRDYYNAMTIMTQLGIAAGAE